jgi:ADP-ribose pyrophosphatase
MEKPTGWKRLRSEEGPHLKLFTVRYDWMQNPRNGATEKMIVLEGPDSVNVVAKTKAGDILFVQQYRFGTGTETVELPGGIIDPGEAPETGAQRELSEETGYTGTDWIYLGKVPSNPVFMDHYIHHMAVAEVEKTEEIQLDEGEDIQLLRWPEEEVRAKLLAGFFQHPHTISALLRYFSTQSPTPLL